MNIPTIILFDAFATTGTRLDLAALFLHPLLQAGVGVVGSSSRRGLLAGSGAVPRGVAVKAELGAAGRAHYLLVGQLPDDGLRAVLVDAPLGSGLCPQRRHRRELQELLVRLGADQALDLVLLRLDWAPWERAREPAQLRVVDERGEMHVHAGLAVEMLPAAQKHAHLGSGVLFKAHRTGVQILRVPSGVS